MSKKEITFNKISFFDLNFNLVIDKLKYGGLLVIPSGPALSTLEKDNQYRALYIKFMNEIISV